MPNKSFSHYVPNRAAELSLQPSFPSGFPSPVNSLIDIIHFPKSFPFSPKHILKEPS